MCYGLRPVGKTTDGRLVVSGFDTFKLMETIGTPLDLIIEQIYLNDMLIDWCEFIDTGQSIGWKVSTTIQKIESAFEDIGMDCTEIIKRIKFYLTKSV